MEWPLVEAEAHRQHWPSSEELGVPGQALLTAGLCGVDSSETLVSTVYNLTHSFPKHVVR